MKVRWAGPWVGVSPVWRGRDHRSGQLHHYAALCQPDSGMGGMEKRGFVLRRLDVMLARGKGKARCNVGEERLHIMLTRR